jgi:hypothetical protein
MQTVVYHPLDTIRSSLDEPEDDLLDPRRSVDASG